jgi:hypothetical protein
MRSLDEIAATLAGDDGIALRGLAARGTASLGWVPNPGPQTAAYHSLADELFLGGSAGGGKTFCGLGLALTQHRRSLILRRINKDAVKLVEQATLIIGHREGYNGQLQRWRLPGDRLVEFVGCEQEADKQRFKGDPHDFIYFDEGTDFLFSQYRFIIGWNRSTVPGQRCRVIVGSNPPTSPEGLWVVKYWGPWLDPLHPRPAKPGELRWFVVGAEGADVEVDGPGEHPVGGEIFVARSRTFIPAALSDNPDQNTAAYRGVLAGLPPELRAAYRDGNFSVGLRDHDFQVIPTPWIEAAQARWKPTPPAFMPMTAIGVDVAQGGDDCTVVAPRCGGWYAPLIRKPGRETREGSDVAAMVVRVRRDNCPVIVDVGGGWGADAVGALERNGIPCVGYKGLSPSIKTSREGNLKFINKRAESWWAMREELNPDQHGGSVIALPPDASIRADLASARWKMTAAGIKIEDKDEIRKRLGRSPDDGDAIVMALEPGRQAAVKQANRQRRDSNYVTYTTR